MNNALGISWEELQQELFTSEEIEASKIRVEQIIKKVKRPEGNRVNPKFYYYPQGRRQQILTV